MPTQHSSKPHDFQDFLIFWSISSNSRVRLKMKQLLSGDRLASGCCCDSSADSSLASSRWPVIHWEENHFQLLRLQTENKQPLRLRAALIISKHRWLLTWRESSIHVSVSVFFKQPFSLLCNTRSLLIAGSSDGISSSWRCRIIHKWCLARFINRFHLHLHICEARFADQRQLWVSISVFLSPLSSSHSPSSPGWSSPALTQMVYS